MDTINPELTNDEDILHRAKLVQMRINRLKNCLKNNNEGINKKEISDLRNLRDFLNDEMEAINRSSKDSSLLNIYLAVVTVSFESGRFTKKNFVTNLMAAESSFEQSGIKKYL